MSNTNKEQILEECIDVLFDSKKILLCSVISKKIRKLNKTYQEAESYNNYVGSSDKYVLMDEVKKDITKNIKLWKEIKDDLSSAGKAMVEKEIEDISYIMEILGKENET